MPGRRQSPVRGILRGAFIDHSGVDPDVPDPVLLDFDDLRAAQKAKFGGEFFPASWQADSNGTPFFEFFQRDREGQPKGIVALNLMELQ